ncbi:origin recognition complex subunit 1 [Cryptococcus deuterogattii MMRL2647]|nr:origin recognition complex subunit 1 [Cryptococcus deuterogattii MMRL2647]
MTIPFTPRRSTRGQVFTPSPFPTPRISHSDTKFTWLSAASTPRLSPGGSKTRTHYTAFSKVFTKGGKKNAAPKMTKFTVGDGVLVNVEGGNDGVAVLIDLWEEERSEDDSEEDEEDGEEEEKGPLMMAEVHWLLRRQDLPDVRRNFKVDDNEVLLTASATRRVTATIPISLLDDTVPVLSRTEFREKYPEEKSHYRGWAYVREGIYWCQRAYDRFAKGQNCWKIDIEEWKEAGKRERGWAVPIPKEKEEQPQEPDIESSDESDEGSEARIGEESDGDEESEGESEGLADSVSKKRKRSTKTVATHAKRGRKPASASRSKVPSRSKAIPKSRKATKKPHPTRPSTFLPTDIIAPELLPTDPFERALRMLHVGATPESLPCREEEFVDVLSKVEEGVESGGGGCLYIAGVPGTGKTATVHAVVKELKRKAEDGEIPPFSYVEINGLKIPTPQHAYTVLWEAISSSKGVSAKTALKGLENHFGKKGGGARGPRGHTFVVLMDELDQLLTSKQDVVYNFFNWPTMRDSQLFVIAVANRMDLPQQLAAKIKSRLGLQTILFEPYDRAALISIVQSRLIPHPLMPSQDPKVLLPDAIALAAMKMAGTNGDARRVLDACRRAVEVALENKSKPPSALPTAPPPQPGPQPVSAKAMSTVLQAMSSSPTTKFIQACSLQQKLMLAALVRCVRREGVAEIAWKNIRNDHDALMRSLAFDTSEQGGREVAPNLLSNSELALVLTSLTSSHALVCSADISKGVDERKVALGMEIGEVGRVLMNEGDSWRKALAGV